MTHAQLSIVDGAWQEAPDSVAIVEETGRGTLYIVSEVPGEAEGRDLLTRQLIETVRRGYATSRGSITYALTEAIREANNILYESNAGAEKEIRRYAGLTAAVLRESELFIAQAGPGVTYLAREGTLTRYPSQSPWFDPLFDPGQAEGEYSTSGAVPIGIRREYTPDLFHVTLQPGDAVLLSTRLLAYLLSDQEVLDAVAHRQPDEIVESIEDLTGPSDLSTLAIVLGSVTPIEPAPAPSPTPVPPVVEVDVPFEEAEIEQELPEPRMPVATHALDAAVAAWDSISSLFAHLMAQLDGARIGETASRAANRLLRGIAFLALGSLRVFQAGESPTNGRRTIRPADRSRPTVRQFGALGLPVLFILLGGATWVNYRAFVVRDTAAQVERLTEQAYASLEVGNNAARGGDRSGARTAFQKALELAQQAKALSPNHPNARQLVYDAEDRLEMLNGISVLRLQPKFATLSGSQTKPGRVVLHWPDLYILDREGQRIYRYAASETGSAVLPSSGDGQILKAGDKVGERTVGDLIDIFWIDAGRLIALDRNGLFLHYDPLKASWTARAAADGSQWTRVTVGSSYAGNIYLLDPSKNQILKYTASSEGVWSTAASYLGTSVNVDFSNAVDMTIDGDVWVLRADGSVWRFVAGRLADFVLRDLDQPLGKSTAVYTSAAVAGLYIADVGNQRIVQFDKVTGRVVRQLRPSTESRDSFSALQTFAADEAHRRLLFVGGNQAYLATIPQ